MGRGAYLHEWRVCWEKGLNGALAQALRAELTPEEFAVLGEFSKTLDQPPMDA